MLITDEIDEFINEISDDWYSNRDGSCNCPAGNPPCSWCVGGYSLPLAEFIALAVEAQFGPLEERNPHSDFDRAMRVLGDF